MLPGWAIAAASKSPNTDRHFRGMTSFSLLPFAFVAQVFAPYAETCGF